MINSKRNKTEKQHIMSVVLCLTLILFLAYPAYGEDMRAASKKAKADYTAALAEARESKERILKDRTSVEKEITRMEADVKKLNSDIEVMQDEFKKLREEKRRSNYLINNQMMRWACGSYPAQCGWLPGILKQS
jgi:peptidoglycan hydrolase CwlO-like protein